MEPPKYSFSLVFAFLLQIRSLFVSPSLRELNFAQKTHCQGTVQSFKTWQKKSVFGTKCQKWQISQDIFWVCNQFAIFWSTLSPKVVKSVGVSFCCSFVVRSSQVIEKHHFLQSGSLQSKLLANICRLKLSDQVTNSNCKIFMFCHHNLWLYGPPFFFAKILRFSSFKQAGSAAFSVRKSKWIDTSQNSCQKLKKKSEKKLEMLDFGQKRTFLQIFWDFSMVKKSSFVRTHVEIFCRSWLGTI